MKDLTKGNESKLIFFFALPMLIGNVFQQLYSTIDSIIVGKAIGKDALAAVGASFPIMFLLISLVMGITMGFTVIISQYYGAKNMEKVKSAIDTAYIFLFFASIFITIIGLLFTGPMLRLLNIPEDIFIQARNFLNIIFVGFISMFGYNSISAILRGLGDSKTPLYFLIMSTVINILLDLLFVLVFHWGVEGTAIATVIAQTFSFAAVFWYLNKTQEIFKFNIKKLKFDKELFIKSFKIGLPSGIQQMLVAAGFMVLQALVNKFGTDVIAAYTAAGRVDSFASMPAMNFSMAVSTFVGQNLGANKTERVKRGYITGMAMSAIISVITTALVIIWSKPLIALFNNDPNVINIGSRYLFIVGAFYVVFSCMFITNGVLRGAGDTLVPMINTLISLWLLRVPAAIYLSNKIGTDGLWWAIPAGWIPGFLLSYAYYKSGRWKRKVVVKSNLKDKAISIDKSTGDELLESGE